MQNETVSLDVVIIGGGQAGLATGYFLKRMNRSFVILDENKRIGDAWRKRWDSLKLFTPCQYDGLPGLPFPGLKGGFPGKEEMADYLERYAMELSLPVQLNVKVSRLYSQDGQYEIETTGSRFAGKHIVVATGTNPFPYIPVISNGLNKDIFQIHSSEYKSPDSVPPGEVLIVGAATSGIEIALELSETHKTFISGNPPFHIPDNLFKYGRSLYWWFINHMLTIKTPVGKKVRKKILNSGSPLIRVSAEDLKTAGIECLPRVIGEEEGFPKLEDNRIVKVRSIVWATGYKPDFSWIDMAIIDEKGWPVNYRGISTIKKGLYFMGMPFQFSLTSGLVGGVGRDAAYISRHIIKN